MQDSQGNKDAKSRESSLLENVSIKAEFPGNNTEHKSEKSNSKAAEKSASSPRRHFTDTDPVTGLVRNVRAVMSQKANKANILTGKPVKDMTGHTGYLTFATLYAHVTNNDEKTDEGK